MCIRDSPYLDWNHVVFADFADGYVEELEGLTTPPFAVFLRKGQTEEMTRHGGHGHVARLTVHHVLELVELVEFGQTLAL